MAVVAVLLTHMDRNAVITIIPETQPAALFFDPLLPRLKLLAREFSQQRLSLFLRVLASVQAATNTFGAKQLSWESAPSANLQAKFTHFQ